MRLLRDVEEWRAFRRRPAAAHRRVALVPTMGVTRRALVTLHHAKERGDVVIATSFVNPDSSTTRLNLARYPHTPRSIGRRRNPRRRLLGRAVARRDVAAYPDPTPTTSRCGL